MAESERGSSSVPIIISGQGKMVCWLVVGKCVKGKLSQINIRQLQTVPNIKIDQYKPLFNQPKPPEASSDGSMIMGRLKYTFSDFFLGSLWSRFKCNKLSQINNRQAQTLPNIKLDQ